MNNVDLIIYGILTMALLVIGLFTLYYIYFAVVYLLKRDRMPQVKKEKYSFLVLVPAHNEEMTLPKTLQSISSLHYPRHLLNVLVVADNCNDKTAQIAQMMGVECLVRTNMREVGKGYALKWGIDHISDREFDVLVIIDADTRIDEDFLTWMNHEFSEGACVAQGFNHISNPYQSPLTRLMEVTSYLKNMLYYGGKRKIGLSSALMGTGMAFHRDIIHKYGWTAFSVGEDWEQTCIYAHAGIPVVFVERAKIYAEEAATFRQGYSQRIRWAGGKYQTSWRYGGNLLIQGIRQRNILEIDIGLTILAPNYSLLANLTVLLIISSLFLPYSVGKVWYQMAALIALGAQILYFCLGLFLMKPTRQTFVSILLAPVFLLWKLFIDVSIILKAKNMKWVRTRRS